MLDEGQALTPREILLVYDTECPLCDAYCRMVRIRESVGTLRLVNARDAGAVMDEITEFSGRLCRAETFSSRCWDGSTQPIPGTGLRELIEGIL